ncbi:MAG: DUF2791 family P-loop domain-containing protein, partial [Anaerolineales bacterium]|nr:DUF2791 family P-loop domain-containing protein [Anaerolineales bacterium]
DEYYFDLIRVLTFMLRVLGHNGMVILLDEIESIVDLQKSSRRRAYALLDSIFFNDFDLENLYAIFSYTPEFVAKLQRDASAKTTEYAKQWVDICGQQELGLVPLTDTEIEELINKIVELHSIAYEYQVGGLTNKVAKMMTSYRKINSVRELVRTTVDRLDASLD